jgi:hypothetical protein
VRHDHVGHHEGDVGAAALEDRERFAAVDRLDHRVAVPCEDVARHEPDGFLVLDEEHGLRALEPGLLKTSRNAPFCFTAP